MSIVYVIEELCEDGAIKIGFTTQASAQSRLDGHQTGNPRTLSIVAEMPGDVDYERQLHRRFDQYRIGNREWFANEGALRRWIDELREINKVKRVEEWKKEKHDLEWKIESLKRKHKKLEGENSRLRNRLSSERDEARAYRKGTEQLITALETRIDEITSLPEAALLERVKRLEKELVREMGGFR